jgi:hypothetical protein
LGDRPVRSIYETRMSLQHLVQYFEKEEILRRITAKANKTIRVQELLEFGLIATVEIAEDRKRESHRDCVIKFPGQLLLPVDQVQTLPW